MWIIDLSGGITATALLTALLEYKEDNLLLLTNTLQNCLQTQKHLLKYLNKGISAPTDLLSGLSRYLQGTTPLAVEEIKQNCGKWDRDFMDIFLVTGEKVLDPFRLFIYLSILILLDNCPGNQLLFTIPAFTLKSSSEAIKIIQDCKIILSAGARIIPVMLAALLKRYADRFIEFLPVFIKRIREIADPCTADFRIRVFECNPVQADYEHDLVSVLETNIDDTTPEIIADAMDQILKSGALDYTVLPVGMKKNRMAFQIQVLCHPADEKRIMHELFICTTTFGIRRTIASRVKLKRSIRQVETSLGKIRVKTGSIGDKMVRIAPEFDDIIKISKQTGKSPQNVYNRIYKEIKINID